MKNILFDSYAILKFYQDEDGADEVEKLLISSRRGDLMSYIVLERKPPSLTFASGRRAKQSYKCSFFLELAGKSQAKNRSAL